MNAPPSSRDANDRHGTSPAGDPRYPFTHRVAVGAYLFRGGRMLLLKRANFPLTYGPPGGRLEIYEDPIEGVRRETREETGMEIRILAVAGTWFGHLGDKPPMLGIDYLAESDTDRVFLSHEHTDYLWASREDIRNGRIETLDKWEFGYRPEALLAAFDLYDKLSGPSAGRE